MGGHPALEEGVQVRFLGEAQMPLDEGLVEEHEAELPPGEPVWNLDGFLRVVSPEGPDYESLRRVLHPMNGKRRKVINWIISWKAKF